MTLYSFDPIVLDTPFSILEFDGSGAEIFQIGSGLRLCLLDGSDGAMVG
jgi:hypothetical protein